MNFPNHSTGKWCFVWGEKRQRESERGENFLPMIFFVSIFISLFFYYYKDGMEFYASELRKESKLRVLCGIYWQSSLFFQRKTQNKSLSIFFSYSNVFSLDEQKVLYLDIFHPKIYILIQPLIYIIHNL